MAFFINKPIKIEAIEWSGDNLRDVAIFMEWSNAEYDDLTGLVIHTSNGPKLVDIGDMIIKNDDQGFHSCNSDLFADTYDVL